MFCFATAENVTVNIYYFGFFLVNLSKNKRSLWLDYRHFDL